MKFLIFILFFASCTSFAKNGILLVAHKETSLADYKTICNKNSYLCFPQAFLSLKSNSSVYFDELIENFDLDNKNYVSQFVKKVYLSLKEDDLTLEKIKNLILATEKIVQTKDVQASILLKKINKIYEVLNNIKDESSDKIIIVAGKNIANSIQNKILLDSYLNDLKYYELDYISLTENGVKKYFLNGDCDHPRYTELVSQLEIRVIPHFANGCNLAQRYDWSMDFISDHLSENKNKYLIGLATVATVFFLKSYQISSDSE